MVSGSYHVRRRSTQRRQQHYKPASNRCAHARTLACACVSRKRKRGWGGRGGGKNHAAGSARSLAPSALTMS
jgi:hypothetical protein